MVAHDSRKDTAIVSCKVNPSPHPFCMLLGGSTGSQIGATLPAAKASMVFMLCALQALTCCSLPWRAVLLASMNTRTACVCTQLTQPEASNTLLAALCPAMRGTYRLA